ncbi:hypothetical protein FACS1894171_2900 [Clostridia bacterium]|nr:hypothetical protein FACS1894171_2900 [Clostridia bacterium]
MRIAAIAGAAAVVVIAFLVVLNTVIIPAGKYADAEALLAEGNYYSAIVAFEALGDYKDAAERKNEAQSLKPKASLTNGDYVFETPKGWTASEADEGQILTNASILGASITITPDVGIPLSEITERDLASTLPEGTAISNFERTIVAGHDAIQFDLAVSAAGMTVIFSTYMIQNDGEIITIRGFAPEVNNKADVDSALAVVIGSFQIG